MRAAGPTTANIGILETAGDNATGIDIAADPNACVVLGLGQCVTSLTADRITTLGDGSAGVLIASPADVIANLGIVETLGADAPAVSIISDPQACILLGAGSCDANLTADQITTNGPNSAGVLVNAPGQIVADLGLVDTNGNGSPAITLITDPAVCILLGAGACGVTLGGGTDGQGPDVDTDGDDSPGVVIVSPGPIDADVDDVDTDGDNSPGIDIDGGEGPITVDFGDVTTDGDNSPGVTVDGTGMIDVTGDSVTTGGANSPGVVVTGADDDVTVDVGAVTTTGPGSNGIDVTTTTGDQTITAGPVLVTGAGSSGIVATATGCANVSVTARADVTSASGIGIDAASACSVSITTLPGADVSGGLAGIEATSGTGSTIVIGGGVASSGGPALDVDGGAATVVVGPTGSITGVIDLTDNADTLTNNGILTANASSNFGAGADLLTNNGVIRVDGQRTYAGLETLTNTGLIEMRDGATGDTLTIPGNYSGSGGAMLGVDVAGPAASDRLIVSGAATGSTAVSIAANGAFVGGATVVDAGTGTTAGAFTLPATTVGLTDYRLTFNAAANDFLLYGTPSGGALSAGLIAQGAREVFYRGNEAVAGHLGSFGDGGTAENPRISRAVWGQAFGMVQDRDVTIDSIAFGQASSANLDSRQDWFGLQMGADLIGGGDSVLGLTAGYIDSRLKLRSNPAAIEYGAWNAGIYGRASFGALFVKGLAKYERYSVDYRVPTAGVTAEADGDGWGGWLEVGARLGGDTFFVEPAASIEYARVDLDNFSAAGTDFGLDEENGLRGKAGVRLGAVLDTSPSLITAYGGVQAIHEFGGRDRLTLSNTGGTLGYDLPRTDTYGRATVGFSAVMASGVRGFIEGSADFAGGVSGGGARAGLSIRF